MTKPVPPEQRRRLPKGERRTTGNLAVRWSALEAGLVKQAAEVIGVDASELVRRATLDRVSEILRSTDPPAE